MVLKQRRSTLLLTSALVGGVFFRVGDTADAAEPIYQFDIPAEPLGQALTDFSQTASQQIIYSENLVKGRRTPGLHGSYTVA
jgi:iron complex outermembrane recepter protein